MKMIAQEMEGPDLTECDREPIHLAGGIQPHGCLLAFDATSGALVQRSQNAGQWLPDVAWENACIESMFGPESAQRLRHIAGGPESIVHPLSLEAIARDGSHRYSSAAHVFDGALIVEFERPREPMGADELPLSLPLRLNLANQRLQRCPDVSSLYEAIADEVRSISGFDRVMVYRFLEGGHGAVVGEAVDSRFESFLGLHYPATDIPQQARRLYVLNTVRAIADVNASPIPLIPVANPATGRPLDLSFSTLRAVSPVHIEYLRNMGVAASMSISILADGELWGLIACHHYASRELNLEERAACEILGLTAGVYLTAREQQERMSQVAERRELLANCVHRIALAKSFDQGMREEASELLPLVDADGIALCWNEGIEAVGRTPSSEDLAAILGKVRSEAPDEVWHTTSLAETFPESRVDPREGDVDEVAGCLAVPINSTDLVHLLFFRREYLHEITWGGSPQKSTAEIDGTIRLSPRLSFEAWRETVRYRSRDWSPIDLQIAKDAHGSLIELLNRRSVELERVNVELSRMNADLDSFAYAASHDLREPLRGLNQTVYLLQEDLASAQNDIGKDGSNVAKRLASLVRLTSRMDELVDGLLRLSRAGRGDLQREYFDFADVALEATDMAWEGPGVPTVHWNLDGAPQVYADYLCVRELLTNLLTNARKYNRSPQVEVEIGFLRPPQEGIPGPQSAPTFYVRDNGIGIAPRLHEEVFQIFRRLHPAGEFGGGSGAGLTIAKKIVERHGGKIWIESAPDAGTTFWFTFEERHR
ncbi:MAG: GAF domain-containing protein [Planctomycetales bacterium]|nr:GAF domain-containing protein [Planctomycetales bacterium]